MAISHVQECVYVPILVPTQNYTATEVFTLCVAVLSLDSSSTDSLSVSSLYIFTLYLRCRYVAK